ncbi:hypothetical protein BJV78DRAFT_920234 [Lactifluus subvellereus]|nr:hypothetical protein BJV78DRAFT_920234 [Lactifluus subvellereus]
MRGYMVIKAPLGRGLRREGSNPAHADGDLATMPERLSFQQQKQQYPLQYPLQRTPSHELAPLNAAKIAMSSSRRLLSHQHNSSPLRELAQHCTPPSYPQSCEAGFLGPGTGDDTDTVMGGLEPVTWSVARFGRLWAEVNQLRTALQKIETHLCEVDSSRLLQVSQRP